MRYTLGFLTLILLLFPTGFLTSPVLAQQAISPSTSGKSEFLDHPLPASIPNGFTVAAVGDLIIGEPEVPGPHSGFYPVSRLMHGADVTFGNLEESLIDPVRQHIWPAAEFGGAALSGPPTLAENFKQMGFNLLSRANNHTTDWGIRGMEVTDRVLDKAGLVHAGTGGNLDAARAPQYLATNWGRVALVAMTSSFEKMEPAGASLRGVPGRPGVNALYTTKYHIVTAPQMQTLVDIYNQQPHRPEHPADKNTKQLKLFDVHYRVGPAPGLAYSMDKDDLDPILQNIRQGKEVSNFEIVYIHAHNPANWSEKPASFLQPLAHDAIDAGADEFVASGPHRLRGIEIYKGKPIFYSLGNFFFENRQQRFLSPDQMQKFHLDASKTTVSEYYEHVLSQIHLDGSLWYQSVVAVSTFDSKGNVKEIKLYPIDLGYLRTPIGERGVPYLASPETSQEILHRLQRLSQPYGTEITIQNNVGMIRVSKK